MTSNNTDEVVILLSPLEPKEDMAIYLDHVNKTIKNLAKSCELNNKNYIYKFIAPHYNAKGLSDAQKNIHIKDNLYEEVKLLCKDPNVKLILAFSKVALLALDNCSGQFGKQEISFLKHNNKTVAVTRASIEVATSYPSRFKHVRSSFNLLDKCIKAGYNLPTYDKVFKFEYVYDLDFVLKNPPSSLAFDTETTGLVFYKPEVRILSVQFAYDDYTGYTVPLDMLSFPELTFDLRDKLIAQLKELLENKNIVKSAHNLAFDYLMIREKLGIVTANCVYDSQQLLFLYDENLPSKSLKEATRLFDPQLAGYSDTFDTSNDKSNMEQVAINSREAFLEYSSLDPIATFRLTKFLLKELKQKKPRHLALYHQFYKPAMHMIIDTMTTNGIHVDVNALRSLEKLITEKLKHSEQELLMMVDKPILQKHLGKGLQLSRADLVRDILFDQRYRITPDNRLAQFKSGEKLKPKVFTDTGEPSISNNKHLPYFKNNEFITAYDIHQQYAKLMSTYVGSEEAKTGFWQHLTDSEIVHPNYYLSMTNTGRSVSKNPNCQNLPSRTLGAKEFRMCFIAEKEPGWTFLKPDYSQAELRVVAWLSKDENMIETYRQGGDLHTTTSSGISGLSVEQMRLLPEKDLELLRYKGKAVNFSLVYVAWWTTLQRYSELTYGVVLSDEEAEKFYYQFFELYPGIQKWQDQCIAEAKRYKQVKLLNGRVRELPDIDSIEQYVRKEAERQSVNCLEVNTEILTFEGWKHVNDLTIGQKIFSVNPNTKEIEQDEVLKINRHTYEGTALKFEGAIDVVSTPNHRWLVDSRHKKNKIDYHKLNFKTSETLSNCNEDKILLTGVQGNKDNTIWTDDEVILLGWVLSDGHYPKSISKKNNKDFARNRVCVGQSKLQNIEELKNLFIRLGKHGYNITKQGYYHTWGITNETSIKIRTMMPRKILTVETMLSMNSQQQVLLYNTMLKGNGNFDSESNGYRNYCAGTKEKADAFSILCTLIGQPCYVKVRHYPKPTKKYDSMNNMVGEIQPCWFVNLKRRNRYQSASKKNWIDYKGEVWCPTTNNKTWIARNNGKIFITGNSPVQGIASDFGILALTLISNDLKKNGIDWLRPRGFIHDQLIFSVRDDKLIEGGSAVKWYMENLPIKKLWNIQSPVPFIADLEHGANLAEKIKLKDVEARKPSWCSY